MDVIFLITIFYQGFNVDIYGDCGELVCERWLGDKCYRLFERHYKFYLSFENSLCDDYVTEKLFRVLKYDLIPIVYGRADYKQFMPYNSYIDVRNFSSASEFLEYVQLVANDEKLFNSYFDWKREYRSEEFSHACVICEALHTNNYNREKLDLVKWWYNVSTCNEWRYTQDYINKRDDD